MLKVGDVVRYVDHHGVAHPALVTHVFPGMQDRDGVNLVFVSGDPARSDSYGRQVERQTSVIHRLNQPANGNYWDHV